MELKLTRKELTERSTIGELYVDGSFECFTLEDPVRPEGVKVPGSTAIPEGEYKVVLDWSDRFQCLMPHLLDVPMFTGIRIHAANSPYDIEGCVGIGKVKGRDMIGESKIALRDFFLKHIHPIEIGVIKIIREKEVI